MMKGESQPTSAREPCAGNREVTREASAAERADRAMEHRNTGFVPSAETLDLVEGNTGGGNRWPAVSRARRCQRTHVRT